MTEDTEEFPDTVESVALGFTFRFWLYCHALCFQHRRQMSTGVPLSDKIAHGILGGF